jgi:hypothetical protein
MSHYRKTAAKDGIIHHKDPVKFAVNFDATCKKERNLNLDLESFVLYVHPKEKPFVLQGKEGPEVSER